MRRWRKLWTGSHTGHPVKRPLAEAFVNHVTRQQRRAELRKMGIEWVNLRYGGELRRTRRMLGLARARNAWNMMKISEKVKEERINEKDSRSLDGVGIVTGAVGSSASAS